MSPFGYLCMILVLVYFIAKLKVIRVISQKISFIIHFISLCFLYFYLISSYKFKHVGISAIILLVLQCVMILRFEFANPGILTKRNAQIAMKVWPYDGNMYQPGKACRHTGIIAPARSRYCKETKYRILKFSHFSYLFSQAIGIGNMRYYLATMLISCLSSIFFSIRCFILLSSKVAPADMIGRDQGLMKYGWFVYLMCTGRHAKSLVLLAFICLSLFQFLLLLSDCISVSRNLTPHENSKKDFVWKRGYNPYDRGFRENWLEILHPPRLLFD